jgi:nicotinate-nucleotide adenylyltransferase
MRVALFGGTFDPIHRGHLAIAAAAAERFALDEVLFAPVGKQPLKLGVVEGAGFADRLAMVRVACEGDARFVATDLDAPRADGGPNYTVDTLERLRRETPEAELFVLVGVDSFLDLPRWREPERLIELAEWIVVSRPGFFLPTALPARVHLLDGVCEDVSATELRERLRSGDDCSELLPPMALHYIREHHLYGA